MSSAFLCLAYANTLSVFKISILLINHHKNI